MTIGVARVLTAIAVAAAVIATKAHAQSPEAMRHLAQNASFYAATERFGYYGTISVYDTLKDAKQEKHARFSSQIVPQRDGSLFVVRNAPNYFDESAAFLTDWYSDAAGDNGGTSNPNNTDLGFIQLYDGLFGPPTTVRKEIGYWDQDHDSFTVKAEGQNATYDNSYARLWNAGYPDIGGEGTKGTFIAYEYKLRAFGMHAVNRGNGFYTNSDNPSRYEGHFTAIFLNQSVNSPQSNGYYVVHLWFNGSSWAASNGYALNDEFGSNITRHGDDDDDQD